MDSNKLAEIFNHQTLQKLFPAERADQFFNALFGDASEGAYESTLKYNLNLTQLSISMK